MLQDLFDSCPAFLFFEEQPVLDEVLGLAFVFGVCPTLSFNACLLLLESEFGLLLESLPAHVLLALDRLLLVAEAFLVHAALSGDHVVLAVAFQLVLVVGLRLGYF